MIILSSILPASGNRLTVPEATYFCDGATHQQRQFHSAIAFVPANHTNPHLAPTVSGGITWGACSLRANDRVRRSTCQRRSALPRPPSHGGRCTLSPLLSHISALRRTALRRSTTNRRSGPRR